MMRTIAALIGALVGAGFGWGFGTVADVMSAWVLKAPAENRYAIPFALILACVFSVAFWRIAGWLKERQSAAVERVERAELRASRERVPTGKTPPTSFSALRA